MSRVAALMIASRVDRPSRGRLVGLGVLVAVIVCTNRLVQNPTLSNAPRQEPRGGAPHSGGASLPSDGRRAPSAHSSLPPQTKNRIAPAKPALEAALPGARRG